MLNLRLSLLYTIIIGIILKQPKHDKQKMGGIKERGSWRRI